METIKSKPVILIAVVILTVIIAAVAIWTINPTPQPPTPTTPSPTPMTEVQSNIPQLCAPFGTFSTIDYKVSCEQAVGFALAEAPGVVKNVSIEPVKISVPTSSGTIERRTVEMWMIDIELTNPYFDESLNKQINVLRIGIRVEENNVIYKKPLQ